MTKKYFLIAGEASGDLHGSHLVHELQTIEPNAVFMGLGGDLMAASGVSLFQHYRHMAYMGFVAVLRNLPQIRENFRIAQQALLREKPDVLVLIDYPSFNLKMAQFCRTHLPATKIIYYIPPKCWAWKQRRVHKIARLSDQILGIFPFEPAFYQRFGYHCTYVGNPTMDCIREWNNCHPASVDLRSDIIAILPGSRRSEISACLPRMIQAARSFPAFSIRVAAAPGIEDDFYAPYLSDGVTLTRDTYNILARARVAIVNSGTATLETALLNCPQVSVYHLAFSSTFVKWLRPLFQGKIFRLPYFTLVNIIANAPVIRELLADEFTVENVCAEVERLLNDESYKKDMLANYKHISQLLGNQPAANSAAQIISSSK